MNSFKILVPLDFSDISTHALHSAKTIAELFDGSITPFHSYVPINEMDSSYAFGTTAPPMEDYEQIEENLRERLKDAAEAAVDPKYLDKPKVALGNPAQAIVDEAAGYDMIVMTTHGRTGFSRFFLGSVSEKVLRMAHVPVLIVNKERELTSINSILLTTDFSENSREAFPLAKELAQKTGATVDLMHVYSVDPHDEDQPDESRTSIRKQRLSVLAKEELHEIDDRLNEETIVSTDTPHEAIINYSMNNPHDLIVMSTVGRTGIRYLMMGSTTANVVRHVKSPVLSINPKSKENEEL